MKISRLKKAILAVCLLTGASAMAQTNITHIVNRGETLQSIASRYGITPKQITDINPDASKMLYVGMELLIPIVPIYDDGSNGSAAEVAPVMPEPVKPKRSLTQTTPGYSPVPGASAPARQGAAHSGQQSQGSTTQWQQTAPPQRVVSYGYNAPKSKPARSKSVREIDPLWMITEAGCGLVQKGPVLPELTFGVYYDFWSGLYGGARVGYKGYFYNKDGVDAMYHLVTIPVELGYHFELGTSAHLALYPYVSGDVNIPVGNTVKINGDKIANSDLSVCFNTRAGLRFRVYGFFIGGAANLAVGDDAKLLFGKGVYPTASIGYTF